VFSHAQLNALAAYEFGLRILPLNEKGKTPPRGYTFKNGERFDYDDIVDWPGNFGVFVGTDHCVIDADPRNMPSDRDTLQELLDDYLDLYAAHQKVLTPQNGQHLWCIAKKGGDDSYAKKIPDYPGLDFIRGENSYVLLPGSRTDKGLYEIHDFSPVLEFDKLIRMPLKLQTRLIKERRIFGGENELTPKSLKHRFESCLNLVHPDGVGVEYPEKWNTKGYELWISILAAAKDTFGDEYRERMRAWSKRGKKYFDPKDADGYFNAKWDSFDGQSKDVRRTVKTLFYLAEHQKNAMLKYMSRFAVTDTKYINLKTGKYMSPHLFNQECAWYVPLNEDGVRPLPAIYYRGHLTVIDESRFDPTKPTIFKRDRLRCHNTFRPWLVTRATKIDETNRLEYDRRVAIWRRHINYVCSREPDAEYVANYLEHWIAHLIRHPGIKMKVAPMLYGIKGSGKGLFAAGVAAMIGHEYVSGARIQDAIAGWGDFYEGKLLSIFNEFVMGYKDRVNVTNIMKELITEDRVTSNIKYGTNRTIDSFCNFIFCANESTDVPIEPNERRYIALHVPTIDRIPEMFNQLDDAAYFRRLVHTIQNFAGMLRRYYLDDFKYDDEMAKLLMYRAPETEAYRQLNEDILSSTDDFGELSDMHDAWKKYSEKVCSTSLAIAVYRYVKGYDVKCSSIRFTKFLKNSLGYEEVSGRPRVHGKQCRVLKAKGISNEEASREIDKLSADSELGRILNPPSFTDGDDNDQFEEF